MVGYEDADRCRWHFPQVFSSYVVYDEFYFPIFPGLSKPSVYGTGTNHMRHEYIMSSCGFYFIIINSILPSIYIFSSTVINLLVEKQSSAQTHTITDLSFIKYTTMRTLLSPSSHSCNYSGELKLLGFKRTQKLHKSIMKVFHMTPALYTYMICLLKKYDSFV